MKMNSRGQHHLLLRVVQFLIVLDSLWPAEGVVQGPGFSRSHPLNPVYRRPTRSKRDVSGDILSVDLIGAKGENVTVDLLLNTGDVPFQKYQVNNSYVVNTPEFENCFYSGKVRGKKNSRVALSNCDGSLTGMIHDGEHIYHIQDNYLYNEEDRLPNNYHCGFPESPSAPRHKRHIYAKSNASDAKESTNFEEAVRKPWNANKNSRYVELILVVDNMEYVNHDRNLQKVYRRCKDIANVMNALYSPLNIYIALVGVVVWTEYDEITLDRKGDKTLTHFLHYRRERLVKDHPNDNAQLLTGIEFEGGVVGKALKGPICTYKFSGGVNMWHSNVISLVATTVAHELGHNFGMEHDDEDCSCPDERCIMAPASSTMKPSFWSSCSLNNLALAFEQGMDYCLRNKPEKLFGGPVCGNGFVEEGEECDCGLKHHCDTPCCDPDTCTLTPGSLCATGECCDFQTCKPLKAGIICRKQDRECDLSEYCTGESEFCPKDIHKADGTKCKGGHAFCYSGSCRTHTDQCQLLWGPTGEKSDNQCYELNVEGTRKGNCGYYRTNDSYVQCNRNDVRCGMLHCSHYNEKLEFGMEKLSILSHSFINSDGEIIPCRTAIVDLGTNDMDPGLAPEGSPCGEGSLCVNQKCMPVANLRIGPDSCHCNGRGVCNSQGNCHCMEGFAPPDCLHPGPGGSLDSGPAGLSKTEESSHSNLLVICLSLALIPILCVCVYGVVVALKCRREKRDRGVESVERNLSPKSRKGNGSFKLEKLFKGSGERSPDGVDAARYDKILISGPTLVSATTDSASNESFSPTHALLPPSSSNGVTKNYGDSNLDGNPGGQNTEVTYSGDKRGFLSNINQSIKSLGNENRLKKYFSRSNFTSSGGDVPKYQIKVEKRVNGGVNPQDDLILSPASSSIVEESEEALNETPPPSYSESILEEEKSPNKFPKSQTLPPIHVNYANNPKLAFPHSSSFEAALAKTKAPPPVKQQALKSPTKAEKRISTNILKKLSPTSPEAKAPSSPSASSGSSQATKRPQISKPVLKTATPSAESLISKAPSTGVSQSSILAIKKELSKKAGMDAEKRSSRGVVFCDPLTLPSPTNPNTPAIIHQPSVKEDPPKSQSSSASTHFWRRTETPTKVAQSDTPAAPIASPESDRITSSGKKISVPPPPPPRANELGGARRSVPISSPVLQSHLDLKTDLLPLATADSLRSKALLAKAEKERPSSVGLRPAAFRPSAPPPPRPSSEQNTSSTTQMSPVDDLSSIELASIFRAHPSPDSLSTSSSNDGGDLLKEILMDVDKKAEAETGESEMYSTLMRKKKPKKGGGSSRLSSGDLENDS